MRYLQVIERNFKTLSVSGEEVLCICPWHDDRSGHLYINARKGVYLCMSCGKKGTLDPKKSRNRDVLFDVPNLQTKDVREKLEAMTRKQQPAAPHRPEAWLKQYDMPTDYWTVERGLSQAVVDRFRLGYDPFTNRATLPLRDMHGNILGITYRRLDGGKPKYLHGKFPIGRHLYGAWLLNNESTVAITEGQIDSIRGWQERIPCVSTMGARITKDQVRVLQRIGVRKVVGLYDNDRAGKKGTIQMYSMFKGSGIQFTAGWYRPYWVVKTQDGLKPVKDPDELSGDRLRKMYHSAVPILEWIERSGYEPEE